MPYSSTISLTAFYIISAAERSFQLPFVFYRKMTGFFQKKQTSSGVKIRDFLRFFPHKREQTVYIISHFDMLLQKVIPTFHMVFHRYDTAFSHFFNPIHRVIHKNFEIHFLLSCSPALHNTFSAPLQVNLHSPQRFGASKSLVAYPLRDKSPRTPAKNS